MATEEHHVFLGDIPNQLKNFDFGNVNAGDKPADTAAEVSARTGITYRSEFFVGPLPRIHAKSPQSGRTTGF